MRKAFLARAAAALLIGLSVWGGAMAVASEATSAPAVSIVAGETEFIGYVGRKLNMYEKQSASSRKLATIPADTEIDVIEKGKRWTQVLYEGRVGYVDTKHAERIQRRDPFGGNMPGVSTHVALAYVREEVRFPPPTPYEFDVRIKAGNYMSIARVDEDRVFFPYMRSNEYTYVPREAVDLQYFVPWDRAEPGDLIYAFTTFYTQKQNSLNLGRMHNIGVACEKLNGLIIRSGEEFSFNKVCGPYSAESGYRLAPILSGNADSGYGGGTCQVNSTLYNIVLRVPAVIVEMHWHSQQGAKYLPAGFDATVGEKSDMRFRNVLPYDVRLGFTYGDGLMTATMYRAS